MNTINLAWARLNIRGFQKYEAQVDRVKDEERRYRNNTGYMPEQKEPETKEEVPPCIQTE